MSIFSRFPYSDFHRLNADWILEKLKEMIGLTQDAAEDAQEAAETVAGYDDRLTAVEADAAGAVRFDESQTLNSTQKTQALNNIGAASASALETLDDVVWTQGSTITALQAGAVRADQVQSFSDAQKLQGRQNIGAAAAADIPTDYVAYTAQSLTNDQKTQARNNIAAAPVTMTGAVRYDATQSLSDAQKAQARQNIGAGTGGGGAEGAVLYSESQELTESQQTVARDNINAVSKTGPVVSMGLEIDSTASALTVADAIQIYPQSVSGTSILKFEGDVGNTQLQTDDVILAGVADPVDPDHAVNERFFSANTPPLPVAADNGKMLVANNGSSSWQEKQIKIYKGTVNTSTSDISLEASATFANIVADVAAGRIVMLELTTQNDFTQIYDLGMLVTSLATFNTFSVSPGAGSTYTLYGLTVTINSSDQVVYRMYSWTVT